MILDMIDECEDVIDEMQVNRETAQKALESAIEVAIRKFYRTNDCAVDLETGTANIVFFMPRHKKIIERLYPSSDILPDDLVPITYEITRLPRPVQKIVCSLFREILSEIKVEADYAVWKKQACRIVEGVILTRQADYLEVDLKGLVGILKNDAWVPSEYSIYRPGKLLYFYVSSVKRLPAGISIILSRSSLRLPALLFKYNLPMYRFVCHKRFIGHKSYIFTDAPFLENDIARVLEMVSKELNGERIKLIPFPENTTIALSK